jgi:hypothetical protein
MTTFVMHFNEITEIKLTVQTDKLKGPHKRG